MNRVTHRQRSVHAACRSGVTLIELLIAFGIVLMLGSLVIPATQSAREAARRTRCGNRLRNLGLAAMAHTTEQGFFPSNGWGFRWVGDPDRGYGPRQPGGWVYNILSYVGEQQVRELGRGKRGAVRDEAMQERFSIPLEVLHCPSRREAALYPFAENRFGFVNASAPSEAARCDYAINAGTMELSGGTGPVSDHDPSYVWPDTARMNGVSFVRSRIRIVDVRDGTSNTILLGEKHLPVSAYSTGASFGDDQSYLVGDDADIRRFAVEPPLPDVIGYGAVGAYAVHAFGSAHPNVTQFVLCDGSVRQISFVIEKNAFQVLARRNDGASRFSASRQAFRFEASAAPYWRD